MMNKMTEKKALEFVLTNCEMPTDVAEKIQAMFDHRLEKATTISRAEQAKRDENDRLRELILTVLADGNSYTISALKKSTEEMAEFSSSKMSSLLKPLVDTGVVLKTYEKRVAHFSLAQ